MFWFGGAITFSEILTTLCRETHVFVVWGCHCFFRIFFAPANCAAAPCAAIIADEFDCMGGGGLLVCLCGCVGGWRVGCG